MSMKWWTENLLTHRTKVRSFAILFVCIALLTSTGCALLPDEDAEEVLPTITPPKLSKKPEYEVRTDTLETKVRGIGKLMAQKEQSLFFTEDNKRIKEIYVLTGDNVERGQLIAELDVSDLERDLRKKKLYFRKDELQMIETLRKASEMDPDEFELAKIDFELKRSELDDLQEKINKAKIMAPFSGTVASVSYRKGDIAKAYESIVMIADLSKLAVTAAISAEDLRKVAVGMEVIVDINAAGQHKGKVKSLPIEKKNDNNNDYDPYNPNAQKQTDSIENYLVVELDKFPPNVSRGTPLSVSVITNRKENAVVIPLAALRSHGGRNYVQVMDEKGSKREVDVEIGQQTSTDVEIIKGLTPGQKVVGK